MSAGACSVRCLLLAERLGRRCARLVAPQVVAAQRAWSLFNTVSCAMRPSAHVLARADLSAIIVLADRNSCQALRRRITTLLVITCAGGGKHIRSGCSDCARAATCSAVCDHA